jgi:pyruvate dehydrogenase E2 component (dihydrolipoamide acetyltransferase)
MAKDKGLNYNDIQGSGPNGRIITRDIENAPGGAVVTKKIVAEGAEFTEQPLSNVRKIIAKAMHSSLQNSAQLTHHMSADVRFLLEARQKIKSRLATDKNQQDITLNDMVCWCVIKALEKFPEANSHFLDDRIKTFHKVHLGLAVDTPRGLMVPAVKDAEEMDLVKLSMELKSAAEACKKGSINPELIQSTAGTFTVSNLGNYGVEMFTPVINLPQVAILGVCTIINRPASIGNNIFAFIPYIGLSLTYDHRAIDGGPATLFLKEIKEQIEAFRYNKR